MAEWASLDQLNTLIGEDSAARLIAEKGGLTIFIPKQIPQSHFLIDIVGENAVELLIQEYSGLYVTIPKMLNNSSKKSMIIELWKKGLSVKSIAEDVSVSDRYVRQVVASVRGEAQSSTIPDNDTKNETLHESMLGELHVASKASGLSVEAFIRQGFDLLRKDEDVDTAEKQLTVWRRRKQLVSAKLAYLESVVKVQQDERFAEHVFQSTLAE